MIGFGCLIFLAALFVVLRKAFRDRDGEVGGWTLRGASQAIPAIARSTLAEGLRAKIATGFIFLILAMILLFFFNADGDGTVKGRVQMFMAYSLGFSAFALSLLTILFSCRSLSREIETHQIFGLVSKPVPRWQILVGKWTGIMLLNVAMLIGIGLATYAGTRLIIHRFESRLYHQLHTAGGMTPEQAERAVTALDNVKGIGIEGANSPVITAMKDSTGLSGREVVDVLLRLPEETRVDLRRMDELRRQVLVARAAVTPEIPVEEIRQKVAERYKKLEGEGRLSQGVAKTQLIEGIRQEVWGAYMAVPPFRGKRWEIQGPPPDKRPDMIMSLRFKIATGEMLPPWRDARNPDFILEDDVLYCSWRIGNVMLDQPQPVRTFKEIELPMTAVGDDGSIVLEFINKDPRRPTVFFELPEAIQVLYVVGSFESNIFRACLAILVPLMCLASFGVLASTFLSFPVASLILICLYVISISMGFVADSFAVTKDYIDPDIDYGIMLEVRKTIVNGLGWTLSIGDLNPVADLMEGRVIGWRTLGWAFLKFDLLKGGLSMLVAVIVFKRRELAAVIV
jgi:hypothetical protein